jgi:hypothetical protein
VQRWTVAVLLVCAGCKFSVDAIQDPGPVGDPDLAVGDPADLASGAAGDLGAVDLTVPPPPDLTPDPCAGAPALGVGNFAASCVIGQPPTIDGDLSDWPTAQFLPLSKTNAAQANGSWDTGVANDSNSSARYLVRWDLTYLYVAISITDDIRRTPNPSGSQLSNNDAIEIFVDGNHSRGTSYGSDDWQLVYSADSAKVASQGAIVAWPQGTVEAWSRTSPSFAVEAAIPWSILGGAAATPGRVVGFDLKLDDNDGDNDTTRDRDLILFYNPGSGNGGCTAPNCRTDAFGAVQLQGR